VVIVVFVGSFLLYLTPACRNNEVFSNIALALFTSLLATIFSVTAEIYVDYKSMQKDEFLEDIHTFGIAKLDLNKRQLLEELLEHSDKEIWVSGYRLILTNQIKNNIVEAIKRGAGVTTVACPPWSEGFQLVYGNNEKVIDNYYAVFYAIYETMKAEKLGEEHFKVYFSNKPLFSDTYKVDQTLVTGPYLHNKDKEYKRIMAKDFFSYILVRESPLYLLVRDEYVTLRDEAQEELNWELFAAAYRLMEESDWNEREKIEHFREACVTRTL